MQTMTRSNYGRLLNGSTTQLASSYRSYRESVDEIDGTKQFHDAYSYECARNDRNDYMKRLKDISAELNARFQYPKEWYRMDYINQRIQAKY